MKPALSSPLCKTCEAPLTFARQNEAARGRKKFCSKACYVEDQKGRRAIPMFREARKCRHCNIDYIAVVKKQMYCSQRCASVVIGRRARARDQSLESHLKRLLRYKGRESLSVDFLMALYGKQKGLCAITGIAMTWGMLRGRVHTHLSLDRIASCDGYYEENVQLVCNIANKMKLDLDQSAFIELCRKIVSKADASN